MSLVHTYLQRCKRFIDTVDVPFLIFLILILHVSLGVKMLGLLFIYIVRPHFKFQAFKNNGPLFYLLITAWSVIELLLNLHRGFNYFVLGSLSVTFWIAAFLILQQVQHHLKTRGVEKIEKSLEVFFVLNALVSGYNLVKIMLEISALNPYTFDGLSFKYSASTGDYINGLTNDLSTANMIINAFGVFYFMTRRKYGLSVLCFIVATVTTSNLGNAILLLVFGWILLFDRSRLHKSLVLSYVAFLVVFIVKISPSNLNYLNHKVSRMLKLEKEIIQPHFSDNSQKEQLINNYIEAFNSKYTVKQSDKRSIDSLIADNDLKSKQKALAPDSNYIEEQTKIKNHFAEFYFVCYGDTIIPQKQKDYYNSHPGKYLSFFETMDYVSQNPYRLMLGAGPGNYSSKLAFKASNLGVAGKYVQKYVYLSPEFKAQHFKLAMNYYLKPATEHSIINFPNSVFNQLLGEYGLVGLILFLVFYVWYFVKRYSQLSYGKILLPLCLIFMLTDYWFECFSIVIVFELMMLLDLHRASADTPKPHHT